MRGMVHEALAEARAVVQAMVEDLRREGQLTDDEVLARYEREHRGRPWAMVQFAGRSTASTRGGSGQAGGGDVIGEALRYEAEMERLMKQQGTVSEGGGGRWQ